MRIAASSVDCEAAYTAQSEGRSGSPTVLISSLSGAIWQPGMTGIPRASWRLCLAVLDLVAAPSLTRPTMSRHIRRQCLGAFVSGGFALKPRQTRYAVAGPGVRELP